MSQKYYKPDYSCQKGGEEGLFRVKWIDRRSQYYLIAQARTYSGTNKAPESDAGQTTEVGSIPTSVDNFSPLASLDTGFWDGRQPKYTRRW